MSKRRILRWLNTGVICSVAASLILTTSVFAMSKGYFSGKDYSYSGQGDAVLPKNFWSSGALANEDAGSTAVPKDYVNSVSNLVTFLKDLNKSINASGKNPRNTTNTDWKITGSAFIVCTMLGKTFSTCNSAGYIDDQGRGNMNDRKIKDAGWDALTARLNVSNIDWNTDESTTKLSDFTNSLYDKNSGVKDTFTWTQSAEETFRLITFKDSSGNVVYRLARDCANPVGALPGLPNPKQWSVSPSVSANRTTAAPGDGITWTHVVSNNGPDATTTTVNYRYQNHQGMGETAGSNHAIGSGWAAYWANRKWFTSTHTVNQNNVNTNLCRSTVASPSAWNNLSGSTESNSTCVWIPYNYTLNPSLSVDTDVGEAGGSYNVNQIKVNNVGPTKSRDTDWRLTKITVNPGSAIPNELGGNSSLDPCGTYFSGSGASCSNVTNGNRVFNPGDTYLTSYPATIPDVSPGTKICYALSVKPHSSSDGNWRHSAVDCVVVGKKPKVQIWGGDLWVGRQFTGVGVGVAGVRTSTSTKNGNTFGSWVEYGIFASSSIRGTGSGSAFATPMPAPGGTTPVCDYSTLSFANTPSTAASCTGAVGTIGNYSSSVAIPDISASFPTNSSTPAIAGAVNVSTLNGLYRATGNLDLSAGTVPTSHWIVINAPGRTVTISGNITYTNALLHNISEIPQLVIIADTIIINGGVTNIEAWLMAKNNAGTGAVYTCEIVGDTVNKCNQPLRVNGPVMTQHLYLRRTAGSGTGGASGDPAEVFNLRADAYLWAVGQAERNSRIRTVYSTELPPRF